MSHSELKNLNVQRTALTLDIKELKDKMIPLSREINEKIGEIDSIDKKIQAIKNRESIVVTEHAILRYLERVQGIDIEEIKNLILPTDVMEQVTSLGSGYYPVKGRYHQIDKQTFKIRVKNNAVVTVLTK